MNKELNEIDKSAGMPVKCKFSTKKIEKVLTLFFLALFFITFNQSFLSPLSIFLYTSSIICILYYILFYRKKTAYVILEDDSIIIARGIFLKDEKIKTDLIKKVYVLDKKIEIAFTKEGADDNVNIFNILLEENDIAAIAKYLQGKQI